MTTQRDLGASAPTLAEVSATSPGSLTRHRGVSSEKAVTLHKGGTSFALGDPTTPRELLLEGTLCNCVCP